jgi:hypothetical protein
MTDHKIQPERITKPIQLLGAWLAGLLAIDSCFLVAAANRPQGSWESTALTIAAIANVPLFLLAVFLLQTRYRPELQEDLYYSSYINQKTNSRVAVTREDANLVQVQQRLERIESAVIVGQTTRQDSDPAKSLANVKFGINKHLKDKEAIARRLVEVGVIGYSSFGTKEPPEKRVIAVSEYLPEDVARSVLLMAAELGFEQYNYFDNVLQNINEDVLFGSYGSGEYEVVVAAA